MEKFFREYPLHILFGASISLLALSSVLVWYNLSEQREFLILHFDAYRGIDFFGNIAIVYQILILSGVMVVLNFFLASAFFHRERFFSYGLALGSIFFAVLLLISISVIIVIN